jgi:hypothetical protein
VASDRVALEVTGSCWEVARIREPHVDRVVVVSPDDTGITRARAKTDRLDARTLARLLWSGELESAWMPDERCRVLRRRLGRREQLVRSRSRAKNEIQAVPQRRLQGKPPCGRRRTTAGSTSPPRQQVRSGWTRSPLVPVVFATATRAISSSGTQTGVSKTCAWPPIGR